jgi:hypothetical protein
MTAYAVWDHLSNGRDRMYGIYKSRERAEVVAKRIYDEKWSRTPLVSWAGTNDTTMPTVEAFDLEVEEAE